jgi:hypothetical protein
MTITSYQIRNVLRTYGSQLKRRANVLDETLMPARESSDSVDISVDARRKQVLNKLTNKLIDQINPQNEQQNIKGNKEIVSPFQSEK